MCRLLAEPYELISGHYLFELKEAEDQKQKNFVLATSSTCPV